MDYSSGEILQFLKKVAGTREITNSVKKLKELIINNITEIQDEGEIITILPVQELLNELEASTLTSTKEGGRKRTRKKRRKKKKSRRKRRK